MSKIIEYRKNWVTGKVIKKKNHPSSMNEGFKDIPSYRGIVKFVSTVCPECKSKENRIYAKNGNYRYHYCPQCNLKFTSVED